MSTTLEAIKAKPTQTIDSDPAETSAVINPYALAELIAGRSIPWDELPDVPRVLEDLLQTPYEELFDPIHEGPLYTGLRLNERLEIEQVRSPLLDLEITVDLNDLENPAAVEPSEIRTLADLGPRFQVRDVGTIAVLRAEADGPHHLRLVIRTPERERLQRLARVLPPELVNAIAFDPQTMNPALDMSLGYGTWGDPGQFFNKAAEFLDPVQGPVANCYLIAAMAAVAWARPFQIKHMTRATGTQQQQFTNLIRFYEAGGAIDREVEVTELVPVRADGRPLYARSSETGEIWPSVYEKAYAKFRSGYHGDHPNILVTAWGNAVTATVQLTGGHPFSHLTAEHTADELWSIVRQNSRSHRTFNPMIASTYSTGAAAEKKVVYGNVNLVANHVYTVLGWDWRHGQKFIVLRNPWGRTEASFGTLDGTFWSKDISWWRPIDLVVNDGVFALEMNVFKHYFRRLGGAK